MRYEDRLHMHQRNYARLYGRGILIGDTDMGLDIFATANATFPLTYVKSMEAAMESYDPFNPDYFTTHREGYRYMTCDITTDYALSDVYADLTEDE